MDLNVDNTNVKVYHATMTDQDGNKWMLQIDIDYFTKIDKYKKLSGHSLCITGEYTGYSGVYEMPCIFVEKIFDQDTGNTIVPAWYATASH
jgi:hypothetical protein